ncbi:MAG: glutamine amidotransferase [Limnochordia bacterium]|jgi:uncharacterized membrane protein
MRRILGFAVLFCMLVAFSGVGMAAPRILLIAKPDQTMVLADYLRPEFDVEIANEPDVMDSYSDYANVETLAQFDGIILGELVMGAGFNGSAVMDPAVQEAIKAAVAQGTGFVHIGGWCSYQGGNADWSGMWHGTPIDEILPVKISNSWDTNDDGVDIPRLNDARHPIADGLDWRGLQRFGGYNKVTAKDGAEIVLSDPRSKLPLIVVGTYGEGTTVAFAGGLAGGWDADMIKWKDFPQLWRNIAAFIAN